MLRKFSRSSLCIHTPISLNLSFIRIETILSCRLVLNLRRISRVRSGQGTGSYDLQFASNAFLGNIGAPLRSADEERDDFNNDIDDDAPR